MFLLFTQYTRDVSLEHIHLFVTDGLHGPPTQTLVNMTGSTKISTGKVTGLVVLIYFNLFYFIVELGS